ncbi:MAG TPA: alpha/beta hydrolase [Burkholderiaceae bacterium]|nr:alpha/beta hydrolase [Burkholderiaceae bacterium]
MKPDIEFLEREYNARAAIRDHPQVDARWAEQGAAARRLRACEADLQYGSLDAERLDLFHAHQSDAPLLVFIHGGYWRSRDKSEFAWIAPPFLQHGVAVALPNYGLSPQTPIEDIVRQQLKALGWLYRNAERLRFDANRIVVAGHSAGGHLTAMMMAALWPQFDAKLPRDLVKAGLAISGLFDLQPLVDAPFLQADLRLDSKRARALSPILMPCASDAPLITAVGALESSEFKRQSTEFGAHWPANLVRHLELPHANHLTVCDELANPASPLFDAALELIRRVQGEPTLFV